MDRETSFAAMLRMARHTAGSTLEELAGSSGVSMRALSDMERGRALGPQRRTVALIADALKLEGLRREEFLALAKAGRTRSGHLAAAPGLAELPGSIGDIARNLGEVDKALDSFQRSLAMAEYPASGMTPSIAAATLPFALGQTARALGLVGRPDEGRGTSTRWPER